MPKANRQATVTPLNPTTSLSRSEVNEVVEVCLAAPMDGYPSNKPDSTCAWGLPLLIEGPPGIAKTARIKQLSAALVIKARSLFAAQHPPEDFSGALIPDGKGDAKQICPLSQVRLLIKEGKGIIFLDEINGAPPATQGALQSFIHERVAGDEEIPGRIRIIAASNPEEMATGGQRLAPALANRFLHISDPGPNAREWVNWLMGNTSASEKMQQPLDKIEQIIIDDWPDVYPETQGLFAGFMEANSSLLHNMPNQSDPQSGKAWPSPRTWDFATRAWATARILAKNDTVRDALIEACVGEGAATSFLTYHKNNDIPKPLDVLHGKWKLNADRLDIVLAAYTGAVAYVRQRPTREDKMKLAPLAWRALSRLYEVGLADIVVPATEGLVSERLGHNSGDAEIRKAANLVLVPLAQSGLAKFMEERP